MLIKIMRIYFFKGSGNTENGKRLELKINERKLRKKKEIERSKGRKNKL